MSAELKIEIQEKGNIVIVTIYEDIDLYNVSALRQAVDKLNNEGKYKQIYNLKNVKFMDSSGLSIFVKQMSILKKNNEVLKLACVGDGIKNLFRWTTLNMYVEIHSTEYEAIQSFNK